MDEWTITIYRSDSRTPVKYDRVKHAWWEDGNYVIAQYDTTHDGIILVSHHYWTWPKERISHIKEERSHRD